MIVALSLAVAVLLFERDVGREVQPDPDEYKVFKAYAKDQVNWVNLIRGDLTVQLVREGQAWKMYSPVRAEAQNERVEKLLEQLAELMEVARPVKVAPGERIKLEQYGLDNPVGKIIVKYGGVEAQLSLGQRTKKYNQLYARLGKENRVMIIDAKVMKLLEDVTADKNFYRSRKIFQDRPIDEAWGIRIITRQMADGKPIILQKDRTDQRWLLNSPVQDRADGEKVKKLLDKFGALRVAQFLEMPDNMAELAQTVRSFGLTAQEQVGVVVVKSEGLVIELRIGRTDEQGEYHYAN